MYCRCCLWCWWCVVVIVGAVVVIVGAVGGGGGGAAAVVVIVGAVVVIVGAVAIIVGAVVGGAAAAGVCVGVSQESGRDGFESRSPRGAVPQVRSCQWLKHWHPSGYPVGARSSGSVLGLVGPVSVYRD